MWEGPLRRGSYARLSTGEIPCNGVQTAKKTCARFIPQLGQRFHQVIPEISHNAKTVWKSPWKSGGLLPEMPLSNWNWPWVFHHCVKLGGNKLLEKAKKWVCACVALQAGQPSYLEAHRLLV
jgi:hypothetical protein